ncbi:hypothetical protein DL98DRAFT_517132 [Cadophora sp. DSE1049]|nr:hypothetical protein DL98DRAFT_517132 [Cadophora sp. DSE1049]
MSSNCPNPSFVPCQGALPNSCCPSTNTCIPLAGNTTVLCCPSGSDCKEIKPITCDLSQQNVTVNPDAVVQTTLLSGTLLSCGEKCCPFGYSCNDNENCAMDLDQKLLASPTAGPSATTSSTQVTRSTSSSKSTDTAAATITPAPSSSPSTAVKLPIVIAVTVLASILAMSILGFSLFWFYRKRTRAITRVAWKYGTEI